MTRFLAMLLTVGVSTVAVLIGCQPSEPKAEAPAGQAQVDTNTSDDIAAERTKLDPEDRALVEAQEWCVISTDERLGVMGPPIKLDIQGQPVFICCKGCKRKAEANPEKTLAKLAELKAKAKAERDAKQ